jgi:hypothetical protein
LITFDVPASDQAELQKHLMERYRRVFQETAIPCDQERIRDIVSTHYPDLRAIANHLGDIDHSEEAVGELIIAGCD